MLLVGPGTRWAACWEQLHTSFLHVGTFRLQQTPLLKHMRQLGMSKGMY